MTEVATVGRRNPVPVVCVRRPRPTAARESFFARELSGLSAVLGRIATVVERCTLEGKPYGNRDDGAAGEFTVAAALWLAAALWREYHERAT